MKDLNWPEYGFQDNLKNMLLTIVQALHILQPIKYPGFSFAWLQLVSSKFLMAPLLRDVCSPYSRKIKKCGLISIPSFWTSLSSTRRFSPANACRRLK